MKEDTELFIFPWYLQQCTETIAPLTSLLTLIPTPNQNEILYLLFCTSERILKSKKLNRLLALLFWLWVVGDRRPSVFGTAAVALSSTTAETNIDNAEPCRY